MTDQSIPNTGKDVGYARAADADHLAREVQMLVDAGVPADRVYTDLGRTGDKARPGLDAALDTLGPGDRLVVTNPDRLARRSAQWTSVQERLQEAGATLRTTNGDTLEDVALLMAVQTGMADSEAEVLRRRLNVRRPRG